ncbi:VOC family protein [Actinophytocola xanthii]|nr:VOC family protein [Actinophytocola xanthii]
MTTLHCYLSYRDAPAALDWLARAFGFETTMRFDDDHGGVMHAEARLGDAAILLFSDDGAGYTRPEPRAEANGQGIYLAVDTKAEVDAVWERAVAAGATAVLKPESTDWGNYRCRVRDPEGYEWTFGIHRPGEPAGEW